MFNFEYSTSGVLLTILALAFMILILIALVRHLFKIRSAKLKLGGKPINNTLISLAERVKYSEVNVNQYRSAFFNMGLFISISCSILILNWQTEVPTQKVYNYNYEDIYTPIDIPRIANKEAALPIPPPPLPTAAEILPVEKMIEMTEVTEIYPILDSDESIEGIDENIAPPLPKTHPKEKDLDEIFMAVDHMPRFLSSNCEELPSKDEKEACAQEEMLQYIYNNVKYPSLARNNNIQGRAVIQFVVETDGTITDIKLAIELQGGLGEEAMRVVHLMASEKKWSPGIQNGKPVRVRFSLPIQFALH